MREAFRTRFGREPEYWVRAPGRVDAMGSHTDYNEGFVLTLSIDRDSWIAAAPRTDGRVCAESMNVAGRHAFEIDGGVETRVSGWAIYVQSVAQVLRQEGLAFPGCDLLVHGTLPLASGLSSSASLEAAAALLFASLGGFALEPVRAAKLCQRAENEVVGVQCGILDQYSSILGEAGSALLLDCRHLTHAYAPIPDDLQPVICDTRAPRELSGSAYGERRASCEAGVRVLAGRIPGVTALRDVTSAQLAEYASELDPTVERRCRFVLEENERVHGLARALAADDRGAIGALCAQSFAGARDLYEISVPAMEAMLEAILAAPGVVSGRQAGAGFGGCMLALVEAQRVDDFVASTADSYAHATGTVPGIHAVRSAVGAGLLSA